MNASLIILLWAIRTARSLLWHTALWQRKEYRLDRMRAHTLLPSTRAEIRHPLELIKWGLVAAFLAGSGADWLLTSATFILLVLYAWEFVQFAREVGRHVVRRPLASPKAWLVILASSGVLAALLTRGLSSSWNLPLLLLSLDRAVFILVAGVVLLLRLPTEWWRARVIREAARRIRAHPQLTTIGITGSYGKTSAKEFLAAILGPQFPVLKTPEHVNTDVGIAQVIRRDLRDHHKFFVCELGAYRRGEIARAADIVKPRIGILTAIADQHLALFGSRRNLELAKAELLQALPASGTAIINGEDPACLRLARLSPARNIIRYGCGEGNDLRAESVTSGADRLSCSLSLGGARATISVPLLGEHHLGSLLAAIAGASALGITLEAIARATGDLRPLSRTMEPRVGRRGTRIVDDSYSANPDGVCAALQYLPTAGVRTCVVVLAPMIELGPVSREAHQRVGAALGRVRPRLTIVTAPDFFEDLATGALTVDPTARASLKVARRATEILKLLEPFLGKETLVLLEGRVPELVREFLIELS